MLGSREKLIHVAFFLEKKYFTENLYDQIYIFLCVKKKLSKKNVWEKTNFPTYIKVSKSSFVRVRDTSFMAISSKATSVLLQFREVHRIQRLLVGLRQVLARGYTFLGQYQPEFAASWLALTFVAAIYEAIVHHAWNFVVAWQS